MSSSMMDRGSIRSETRTAAQHHEVTAENHGKARKELLLRIRNPDSDAHQLSPIIVLNLLFGNALIRKDKSFMETFAKYCESFHLQERLNYLFSRQEVASTASGSSMLEQEARRYARLKVRKIMLKDVDWRRNTQRQASFEKVKRSQIFLENSRCCRNDPTGTACYTLSRFAPEVFRGMHECPGGNLDTAWNVSESLCPLIPYIVMMHGSENAFDEDAMSHLYGDNGDVIIRFRSAGMLDRFFTLMTKANNSSEYVIPEKMINDACLAWKKSQLTPCESSDCTQFQAMHRLTQIISRAAADRVSSDGKGKELVPSSLDTATIKNCKSVKPMDVSDIIQSNVCEFVLNVGDEAGVTASPVAVHHCDVGSSGVIPKDDSSIQKAPRHNVGDGCINRTRESEGVSNAEFVRLSVSEPRPSPPNGNGTVPLDPRQKSKQKMHEKQKSRDTRMHRTSRFEHSRFGEAATSEEPRLARTKRIH